MLVLSRKQGEVLDFGNGIRVTILGNRGSRVRVGIDAPKDVRVLRGELKSKELRVKRETGDAA